MKRLSLYLFLIFFTLQAPSLADDIRDFQIEGMSIGDSLLDYYSEDEIKKQLSKTNSEYKSDKLKRVWFSVKNPEIYRIVTVHFKKDTTYTILNVGGSFFYNNNIKDCYSKQKEVVKDIEESFPNALKKNMGKSKHRADKSGKSTLVEVYFKLKSGEINISCTDWSKQIENERNWNDNLSVDLDSPEFLDWIQNEAYK